MGIAPLPRGPAPARERKAAPVRGSSTPVETFFAPARGANTTVEIFFAHAHPKWLIFNHFHRAGAIFLSQRHPERPPGATQGRSFFHAAPQDDTKSPPAWRPPRGMGPGHGTGGLQRCLAGQRADASSHRSATQAPLVWRPPRGMGPGRGAGGWRPGQDGPLTGTSLAQLEAAAGPAGPGHGTGGRRQGQGGQHTEPRPIGGRREACGAWPGFEPTRRAKLAARTASGRAGHAAAGGQAGQQATTTGRPPPTGTHSGPAHQGRPRGAWNTSGATSNTGNQAISGSQAPSGSPTWQQHPSARAGSRNRRQPTRGPRPRQ